MLPKSDVLGLVQELIRVRVVQGDSWIGRYHRFEHLADDVQHLERRDSIKHSGARAGRAVLSYLFLPVLIVRLVVALREHSRVVHVYLIPVGSGQPEGRVAVVIGRHLLAGVHLIQLQRQRRWKDEFYLNGN